MKEITNFLNESQSYDHVGWSDEVAKLYGLWVLALNNDFKGDKKKYINDYIDALSKIDQKLIYGLIEKLHGDDVKVNKENIVDILCEIMLYARGRYVNYTRRAKSKDGRYWYDVTKDKE